jgi:hypothetical protein
MRARLNVLHGHLRRQRNQERASGASRQYAGDNGWLAIGVLVLALGCIGVYLLLGLF